MVVGTEEMGLDGKCRKKFKTKEIEERRVASSMSNGCDVPVHP